LLSPSAAGFGFLAAMTFAHVVSRLMLSVERPLDHGRMIWQRPGIEIRYRDFRHALFIIFVIFVRIQNETRSLNPQTNATIRAVETIPSFPSSLVQGLPSLNKRANWSVALHSKLFRTKNAVVLPTSAAAATEPAGLPVDLCRHFYPFRRIALCFCSKKCPTFGPGRSGPDSVEEFGDDHRLLRVAATVEAYFL
jgi:hypothetical protein